MTERPTLVIKKFFSVPPARLFQAFCRKELYEQWWHAGEEYDCSLIELDFKVGGAYRLGMRHIEKQVENIVTGIYKEIIPDRKIVKSWRWESAPPETESEVILEFAPAGDGCELTLTHRRLVDEESKMHHEKGWCLCFDELENAFTPKEEQKKG